MEDREEVGLFHLFQPNSFVDSVKIKTKDGFLCRIFPIELFEFLLRDGIIRIDIISQKDIMYSGHRTHANMTELLTRGWDDKADKVVHIHFEEVSEKKFPGHPVWVSLRRLDCQSHSW